MGVIQDITNYLPSWQNHIQESGYLKAPGQKDYHQKAGYNFKENFPNTPAYLADALAKGYQYSTEGIGSFFNEGTFSDAMARAKEESRLNSLGFRGQGFDMDEYNQTMDFARTGDTSGLTYSAGEVAPPSGTDVIGMDEMNTYGQVPMGTDVIGMDEMNTYGNTPLDMERFAGVSKLGRNDADVEQVDYLGNPTKFQNFKSKAKTGWEGLKGGLQSLFDKTMVGRVLGGIGNQFEDRQLTGDIMDESGNMYSAEALNKMNAKGGYYTDPARSARRRTSRISNMRNRLANDKKISDKNLHELVAQEKAQQLRDAQNAADRANIQNIQNYTGQELSGYRMSRPASERGFTGHGKSGMGRDPDRNKAQGGRVGYGNGGLATLFARRG